MQEYQRMSTRSVLWMDGTDDEIESYIKMDREREITGYSSKYMWEDDTHWKNVELLFQRRRVDGLGRRRAANGGGDERRVPPAVRSRPLSLRLQINNHQIRCDLNSRQS